MIDYKIKIAEALGSISDSIASGEFAKMLEVPPNPQMGDFSLPCFKLSKSLRKAPPIIAEEIRAGIEAANLDFVDKIEAVSGYVNVFLNKSVFVREVVQEVLHAGQRYGSDKLGAGKSIVIDYSSPNIAKPFHVGHLRSTMIGQALANIHRYLGYQVVGINHLGDWGTQFGKQIVAYKKWGNEAEVEAGDVRELVRLYVKFHEEAENHPELEDEARAEFLKLEQGDPETVRLWKWFIEISYRQFDKIYDLLGVKFDSLAGESFYNDKMAATVQDLEDKGLLTEDDGARIVRLDDYNMPPALIIKSDGATLYHTRDIAAAQYRMKTYDFEKAIYVTDYAQNLHFAQWFKVIELMGYEWASKLTHVAFGRVNLETGGFSTRKGNTIWLEEVLEQAIAKTADIIEAKNPDLENKEQVARDVGVGAIIFNDLKANRIKDVIFSWEEMLSFDGETGPYVQYTHARTCSLLRKAADQYGAHETSSWDAELLTGDEAYHVIKDLYVFPERIHQAMDKLEPSIISRYLVDLAQSFNRFYHECPIVVEEESVRTARLTLVRCTEQVFKAGLGLIGLAAPEKI
jgi:arginyl-tRNA synthetase